MMVRLLSPVVDFFPDLASGVVTPSPACARALDTVALALKGQGHEVHDVSPPSPYEGLKIASVLLNADGCKTYRSFFRTGEWEDRGAAQMSFWTSLPGPARYLYYLWVKYVRRDEIWAGLLENFAPHSAYEQWKWVNKREAYKATWHDWWREQSGDMDVLITVPNATPAVPHNAMLDAFSSCGYTFLFNLVSEYLRKKAVWKLMGSHSSTILQVSSPLPMWTERKIDYLTTSTCKS